MEPKKMSKKGSSAPKRLFGYQRRLEQLDNLIQQGKHIKWVEEKKEEVKEEKA
jgi:precorrin-6B methylase 1